MPKAIDYFIPRDLMLLWSLWLLASVLISLLFYRPLIPGPNATEPASRWLMQMIMLGLHVIWPLFQLSLVKKRGHQHERSIGEWFSFMLIAQFAILPLWMLRGWSLQHTLMIDLVVLVWSLPTAMIIACCRKGSPRVKCFGMLACLLLPAIGPLIGIITLDKAWLHYCPYIELWRLSIDYPFSTSYQPILLRLGLVMGLTILGWCLIGNWQSVRAKRLEKC